jgi:tRNA G18 (ribose-2'-O)-methylase SpoU
MLTLEMPPLARTKAVVASCVVLVATAAVGAVGVPVSAGEAKFALIFGNEVNGVKQTIVDRSHYVIEIPQFGTKHSLNVSVCAGIVLWEFCKKYL